MASELVKVVKGYLDFGNFKATPSGLVIKGKPTFDEWSECGEVIQNFGSAHQWLVGDWLAYGEKSYGETFSQAIRETGQEYQTLQNSKYVCGRIEMSRRRDNLSFAHHSEVAALEPSEQDELLDWATTEAASRNELRAEVKRRKNKASVTPPLPDGKYRVIYADPPWEVGSIVLDKWESPLSDKYPTMPLEEIMALDVASRRADDCSLFLWTTQTFLHEAFHVIEAWGFKYHICLTWDKGGGWTSNGFHRRTELCLYAYSGKMNIPSDGEAIPALIVEAKREHSRKPDALYELIEARIPEPRIELFARKKRPGWDVWGNQA